MAGNEEDPRMTGVFASQPDAGLSWPALPLDAWRDTYETLHMWTQIVGKIRLALSPRVNHWWNVALYVSPCGLTTSAIPYGSGAFEIQFDFVNHELEVSTSSGARNWIALSPQPVAAFYSKLMASLHSLGVQVAINTKPQEIADPIPFEEDSRHASYDPEYVQRFWRILMATDTVLKEFRSGFLGKCSPVHFFWGSFDLCCTRFSGRRAPSRKGVITSEAYSHEVISAGFWPGAGIDGPAFYAYSAPSPAGLSEEPARPAGAFWSKQLSEFILMYDEVRRAESPRDALLEFLESTYAAGARLANWDRSALERNYAITDQA
jgi:hypothetical protein